MARDNKRLGARSFEKDAERLMILSQRASIPSASMNGLWFRIWVMHADASPAESFPVSDAGLSDALAAALDGDSVHVPPVSLSPSFIIPAGVTLLGWDLWSTVFTGKVTMGAGSRMAFLSVVRCLNGADADYCVVGPSSESAAVVHSRVVIHQNGAGDVAALQSTAGGTLEVEHCRVSARAEGGGDAWGGDATAGTMSVSFSSVFGSTATFTGANASVYCIDYVEEESGCPALTPAGTIYGVFTVNPVKSWDLTYDHSGSNNATYEWAGGWVAGTLGRGKYVYRDAWSSPNDILQRLDTSDNTVTYQSVGRMFSGCFAPLTEDVVIYDWGTGPGAEIRKIDLTTGTWSTVGTLAVTGDDEVWGIHWIVVIAHKAYILWSKYDHTTTNWTNYWNLAVYDNDLDDFTSTELTRPVGEVFEIRSGNSWANEQAYNQGPVVVGNYLFFPADVEYDLDNHAGECYFHLYWYNIATDTPGLTTIAGGTGKTFYASQVLPNRSNSTLYVGVVEYQFETDNYWAVIDAADASVNSTVAVTGSADMYRNFQWCVYSKDEAYQFFFTDLGGGSYTFDLKSLRTGSTLFSVTRDDQFEAANFVEESGHLWIIERTSRVIKGIDITSGDEDYTFDVSALVPSDAYPTNIVLHEGTIFTLYKNGGIYSDRTYIVR